MAISEELWEAFLRFDREIVRPQFETMSKRFDTMVNREEFNTFADQMYARFERLERRIDAFGSRQ